MVNVAKKLFGVKKRKMRMAKKRSSPVFVVVPAFLLDCVDDKKVLDLEAVESEVECRGPLSDVETYPADDLLA